MCIEEYRRGHCGVVQVDQESVVEVVIGEVLELENGDVGVDRVEHGDINEEYIRNNSPEQQCYQKQSV